MAKLWQFSQSHPKPAFSEKVQRGDQGKFFKNRPKRCPRLKGPKALWRKWYYPLNSMHLKCKDWTRFRREQRLQKCPNFHKVTENPHFLKKCKGGTKGNFSKNRPKGCPRWKGLKAVWRTCHYPLISMHFKCKNWKRFRRKQRLQRWPNRQVMAIFGRSPKTLIF